MLHMALKTVRLLIVSITLYLFFYQYLFNKYTFHLKQFDKFNWRNRFSHQLQKTQTLNFTQNNFLGHQISVAQSINRPNNNSCIGQFSQIINEKIDKLHQLQTFLLKYIPQNFSQLFFAKKIDSYQFNFYNWYRFEFTFTDFGYDSYLQFRLIQAKKGSHEIVQKISFKLPNSFYPHQINDKQNMLHINFQAKDISLNVSQFTVSSRYNDSQSDGLQHELFFNLTQNKSFPTQQQYKKFGSSKTLTQFNFTFLRKDYEIKANLTHVIRHNQCITNYQNQLLRHKCMGGYGKGKMSFSQFLRQNINLNQKRYTGSWQRNSYNLDNTRVRTIFVGERYIVNHDLNSLKNYLPKVNLNNFSIEHAERSKYRSLQIDFIGFNKLEYYAKGDRIQKQRWVGMSLYYPFQSNKFLKQNNVHENYFFINGNIHPIYDIKFDLPHKLKQLTNGKTIIFINNEQQNYAQKLTPSFHIEFMISNSTIVEESGILGDKKIYRADGYWKGWIDEGTLFENQTLRNHYNASYEFGYVEFYEIMGTLKFVQQNC